MEPNALFPGTLLFTVPHMDDEVLACGGTIARLTPKDRIHILYVTDGSRSPAPLTGRGGSPSPELPAIRRAEAREAMARLGIGADRLHFLDLPDGSLHTHATRLRAALEEWIDRLDPDFLFTPFRFDRHPDHLALNRAVRSIEAHRRGGAAIIEYFVYYRWRMLPGGDVRRFLRGSRRISIDIADVAALKREALECYVSQTTRFFDWQRRPILPPERVAAVSRDPECFFRDDSIGAGMACFERLGPWIRIAHFLEPRLKAIKEQLKARLR